MKRARHWRLVQKRQEGRAVASVRGAATIHGRKFWVSGWIKTSEKSGQKFMSLAFRPKEEAKPASRAANFEMPPEDEILRVRARAQSRPRIGPNQARSSPDQPSSSSNVRLEPLQ